MVYVGFPLYPTPVADIAATRLRHAFRFVFAKLGNKKTPYKFIMVHSRKKFEAQWIR